MAFPSSQRLGRPRGGALLWALMALAVGLGFTLWAAQEARQHQRHADRLRLERHAQRILRTLQARLASYEDILRGAHAFLNQDAAPSPSVWQSYARDLDFLHRHPGLKTLAYIERVPRNELPAFLAIQGAKGSPLNMCSVKSLDPSDHAVREERLDLLVITRAEPSETASKALGMDVGTSFNQREAAERAAQSGAPAMSGLLQFRLGGVPHASVAVFYPVFCKAKVLTAPVGRAEVKGWVSLGLYVDALLDDVKKGSEDAVSTSLFDLTGGRRIRVSPRESPDTSAYSGSEQTLQVDAFGRAWVLTFCPLPGFFDRSLWNRTSQILLGGLLASLSLGAIVWSLASTRDRARRMAEDLTRGLRGVLGRLDMLIESTPVGVVEWDSRLKVRRWNPAAGMIFGFSAGEMLDHSGRGIWAPGPVGDRALAALAEVIREGHSISGTQETKRKDGQHIVCEWTSSPIFDAEGRVEGVLSLVMDVTERRRTEERAWLQQKVESLGVMAGGIAHDFNNLLWAITGNAELARAHVPPGNPAHENLARIEAAAFRAADLARQMLAYSGRAPFVLRSMDLGAAINEMEDLLRAAMPSGVRIEFDVQPGIPGVKGDEGHIQQALRNILTNAAEALCEGGGVVRVNAFPSMADESVLAALVPGSVLAEGPVVCLEVLDDGPGLAPEMLGKVFDPFFTTKAMGRGLGLSATLGIMRAHSGGITLESEPGKGARVTLYFPATPETPQIPLPETRERFTISGGTILLAEDEDILRDLTVEALEPAGFRVVAAKDGLEALELFQAQGAEISVVVMDLNMPRMGGLEAFRRIRSLDPRVKVILCSGYAEEEIGEFDNELRPDGFLHKPYRLRELLQMVQELAL